MVKNVHCVKFISIFLLFLLVFDLTVFAEEKLNKADYPNIPSKYIDLLLEHAYSTKELETINQQIVSYQFSSEDIEKYMKKLCKNNGEYPHDKEGNTITPYGIVPHSDVAGKWKNEHSVSLKVGEALGSFQRLEEKCKLRDLTNNKISYLPVYGVNGDNYLCVEDLVNAGFSHHWDERARKTTMLYDGKTYQGLSKQSKTSGKIFSSDVTIAIQPGLDAQEHQISNYNIGGFSLVKFSLFQDVLKDKFVMEVEKPKQEPIVSQKPETKVNTSTVDVTIPSFPVKLNGVLIDNQYNKYPLLVYKDITYFPMTYDGARFLGLKANWYEKSRMYQNKGVLFVGVCPDSEKQDVWNVLNSPLKNETRQTAKIANYGLALNTTEPENFIDNQKEEYPILNFRDISYFPLTWKYAVDQFGWEYSYTEQEGLNINSGNAFKPVLDDKVIGYTSPHMKSVEYYYGENLYVVYPYSSYAPVHPLIIRKRGEEEKEYDLAAELKKTKYMLEYFNVEKNENGAFVHSKPYIKNNLFYLNCKGYERDAVILEAKEIEIAIDLSTGKIVSEVLK